MIHPLGRNTPRPFLWRTVMTVEKVWTAIIIAVLTLIATSGIVLVAAHAI